MKLIYDDGTDRIIMPRTRPFTLGGVTVEKKVYLAGGKLVKEIIGIRDTFTAEWDWVPVDDITRLIAMLRRGQIISVTMFDPVDGEQTKLYNVSYPELKVWRYIDGVPRWHDITLTHEAQELRK